MRISQRAIHFRGVGSVAPVSQSQRGQRASTLMLTLMTGGIIGFSLVGYLSLVEQQNRSITRAQVWNYSMAVAEAGIEEALTHLHHNYASLETDGWSVDAGNYVKEGYLDGNKFRAVISNTTPPVIYSQSLVRIPNSSSNLPPRTVRVKTARSALFGKGIVAKGLIDMYGNNIRTDSFDSADPNYSTAGVYDPGKTKDNGDVATNSTLTNSLNVGNAKIHGRTATGPGGSMKIGPNGAVGNKAWIEAGSKGLQSGRYTDDMNVSFFDVEAPFPTALSPWGGVVNGTNYMFVMGNGNYQLSSLAMSGSDKILVGGQATLYVTGNLNISGKAFIYIQPGASLRLYVGGASASIAGCGLVNPQGNALNLFYYGMPSNTSLSLSGNAAFTGVVYAPSAFVTLGGGGSDPYDFVGAIVAGSVRLNGHYSFHYDENLARVGPAGGFRVTAWDEI